MGSWRVDRANVEDAETLYALLEDSFFFHEPATKQLYEEKGVPPIECCMSIQALDQGLSFKASLPSGEIVGAALNLNKEALKEKDIPVYGSLREVVPFFDFVDERSHGDEKGWLTLQVLVVHTSWRRQGVAEELVRATQRESVEKNFRGVRVMCTSAYTARLFEKKGWDLVYRLPYSEYRCPDGRATFRPEPPHLAATVYLKRNEEYKNDD